VLLVTSRLRTSVVGNRKSDLGAEAALALLIAADGSEEIDLAERRPARVAEIELAIGTLPEEEAGEANLPTCPNDEIRIGEIIHIEIFADLFGCDFLRHLLGGRPPPSPISQQLLHRVGDLAISCLPPYPTAILRQKLLYAWVVSWACTMAA